MMKLTTYNNSLLRVNFSNINVLEIRKVNDWYELDMVYKEKMKKELKSIPHKFKDYNELDKILNREGFRLLDGLYINLNNACMIEKKLIKNSLTDINVSFYYNSYPTQTVKVSKAEFQILESHFLVF